MFMVNMYRDLSVSFAASVCQGSAQYVGWPVCLLSLKPPRLFIFKAFVALAFVAFFF